MIEILNFNFINKGFLVGSVDVRVPKWGGFVINGIKVFQKNATRWINFPDRQYEENGEKKYFPINKFDDPKIKKSFEENLLTELDIWREKKQPSTDIFPGM